MKKYKITVDGKSYEVEVEELTARTAAPATQSAPVQTTALAPPDSTKVEGPVLKTASQSDAPISPDFRVGEKLPAPMPGTILSVFVTAGQAVKRGEPLLILEAMKMENEIVAHKDGVISGIYVQKNSTVNAGDPLVSFTE